MEHYYGEERAFETADVNKFQWVHTEKSFRNLIKSNPIQVVFTMHRLIWDQTEVRLVPNQSVHGKYNLISG